jgi:hypothetical protein
MHVSELQFFTDPQIAASDPDAIAKLLLLFAKQLKNREPLGESAANYLAHAFEKSMVLPQKQRGPALLRELKLTYGSRRPNAVRVHDLAEAYEALILSGINRTQSHMNLAQKYDISESTVARRLKRHYSSENN